IGRARHASPSEGGRQGPASISVPNEPQLLKLDDGRAAVMLVPKLAVLVERMEAAEVLTAG
ncbi:MAG TPA: hypothetical protein VHS03_10805, partial [Gaiellaceae bacterium]|nr:hypothetical protein [Gaiellaceae bacterium]